MTAEQLSASFVETLPLQGSKSVPKGYFRSKLFITPFTNNPLVAAAGPIFSLLERLNVSKNLPPIEKLRLKIEHELHAFHSRLAAYLHNEEVNVIAQYFLCATIDELIGKAYIKAGEQETAFHAFTPSSYDNIGPEERFFIIVQYVQASPNQYLDLIELAYYCLIAGFEGMHHSKTDGRQVLDNLLEDLFQLIQQYRVNQTYKLFHPQKKVEILPKKNHKPLLMLGMVAFGLLFAAYFTSYTLLEVKARSVQFGHAVIAKLDN